MTKAYAPGLQGQAGKYKGVRQLGSVLHTKFLSRKIFYFI